jgi:hypothetical protein
VSPETSGYHNNSINCVSGDMSIKEQFNKLCLQRHVDLRTIQ